MEYRKEKGEKEGLAKLPVRGVNGGPAAVPISLAASKRRYYN